MSAGKTMNIINAFKVLHSRKRKANTPLSVKCPSEDDIESVVKDMILQIEQSSEENKKNNFLNCNGHVSKNDLEQSTKTSTEIKTDIVSTSENEKSFCSADLNESELSLSSSFKSSDTSFNSSLVSHSSNVLMPPQPKKRKRMSPEEAKRRTEKRAEQERLKEEKRLEKLRKEEEKAQVKLEKQRKKEEEDRLKEKLKQEKKEQEEKEKQQKLQEKEELLKIKQLLQEAKAEEKKKKEIQKMKVLEEKLKALEEKKKQDEEKARMELENEKKKSKTKQAFEKFFLKPNSTPSGPTSTSPPQTLIKESAFLPFQVSEDMVLAPVIPSEAKNRFDKNQLDHYITHQGSSVLYIENLKSAKYFPVKLTKEKNKSLDGDAEIVIIEPQPIKSTLKAKLFQFHENIRPPYWGTWRKKSSCIKPRKPFGLDNIFDYEVDSDEEWDEGGPGESLNGTEDEESEDDYEVDNEFFVPHGYLSAEEEGEDEEVQEDPETQRARLKMKEREFLSERNKKTTELKPIILGCFFQADVTESDTSVGKLLQEFEAEFVTTKDVLTAFTVGNKLNISDLTNSATSPNEGRTPSNIKRPVPDEAMPFLIRLLHGNTNGRQIMIKEFQKFWLEHCLKNKTTKVETEAKENNNEMALTVTPHKLKENYKISKRQLDFCITSIAAWCKPVHPTFKKLCWMVKEEILQKYGFNDLSLPSDWTSKTTENDSVEIRSSQ